MENRSRYLTVLLMKNNLIALLVSAAVISAQAQLINGAGSSFDSPAFSKWIEAYTAVDRVVHFNYQSVGSGRASSSCSRRRWISGPPTPP